MKPKKLRIRHMRVSIWARLACAVFGHRWHYTTSARVCPRCDLHDHTWRGHR